MSIGRFFRILFGILLIAAVVAYCYFVLPGMPKSGDFGKAPAATAEPVQAAVNSEPEDAAQPVEAGQPVDTETPAPEVPTIDPDSPAGRAAALGLPAPPDIDVTSWEYTLVNGDHSIGQYAPEQLAYLNQTADATDIQYSYNGNRCPVDARIAQPLLDMALACKAAGLPIYLSSGYRSYNDQAANFRRICENNGISDGKINGYYVTMPAGCSEHQLALCCDITDKY